jgi:hypothetical protein
MIYKGLGSSLELLEDRLIIRRSMILGTIMHGLKGEKTIPYSAITAVQYKPSGLVNGYIQFSVGGGSESKKGIWDATKDENTLMFSDDASFQEARAFVEDRIGARPKLTQPSAPSESIVDTLEKLAALRDRGILSSEEFEEQKAKVLGKTLSPTLPAVVDVEELPSEAKIKMMAAMEHAIQAAPKNPTGPIFGKRAG